MKRSLWGAVLAPVLLYVSMSAQISNQGSRYSKDEQEVVDVDRELNEASLRSDIATLERIWAADVTFIGNDGRIWKKAERLEDFRARNRAYASQRMLDFDVRAYQETAIVAFTDWIEGVRDGRPFRTRSILTRVYMKRGGLWRLVHQHSALLERISQ